MTGSYSRMSHEEELSMPGLPMPAELLLRIPSEGSFCPLSTHTRPLHHSQTLVQTVHVPEVQYRHNFYAQQVHTSSILWVDLLCLVHGDIQSTRHHRVHRNNPKILDRKRNALEGFVRGLAGLTSREISQMKT